MPLRKFVRTSRTGGDAKLQKAHGNRGERAMSFEIRFPAIATERELADKPFSSKEHYFKKRWTRATCASIPLWCR